LKKEKLIIIFTVLVDVIGFGIVIPILPFYVTEFGASPSTVTFLFASFSLFAFISSPLLGALSDRIGRRPVLIVSIISTAIGWFVFAGARSIPFLFLGRIIDGAAAGNFSIAQSYLVDISEDEKERTANLGIIGAIFGVGFMLGPIIGGALAKVSHAFPFWCAGGLATLNAITAYFFLPETNIRRKTGSRLSLNPLAPIQRAIRDVELHPLYITWIMFALANVTSQTVFALFVSKNFGFDAFTTGLMFTAIGIVVAFNQTILLKRFWLKRFDDAALEKIMLWFLIVGLLLFVTKSIYLFAISVLLNGTGQSVLRVVLTSQVAGAADSQSKGEKLGILSSFMSASMVVGPIIAGILFEVHDTLPYFAAATYLAFGLVIADRYQRNRVSRSDQSVSSPPGQVLNAE
jgi:DHA1 family tetracycline resistance protein-like MFS transporter